MQTSPIKCWYSSIYCLRFHSRKRHVQLAHNQTGPRSAETTDQRHVQRELIQNAVQTTTKATVYKGVPLAWSSPTREKLIQIKQVSIAPDPHIQPFGNLPMACTIISGFTPSALADPVFKGVPLHFCYLGLAS